MMGWRAWYALAALVALPAHADEDLRIVLQADPNAYEQVEQASISDDGRYALATAPSTGTITIWDVPSGNIIDRLQLPVNSSNGALVGTPHLSPDAKQIVVRAFTKQASPYACQYVQFNVTLRERTIARDILRTTPPGKTTGFTPGEAALCDFSAMDPPSPAKPPRWQIEVLPSGALGGARGIALRVIDTQNHLMRNLIKTIPDKLVSAALSPDARNMAYVNLSKVFLLGGALMITRDGRRLEGKSSVHFKLSIFNLATSQFLDPIEVIGYAYGNPAVYEARLNWRDATHLVLTWALQPGMISGPSVPPDSHVYDITTSPVGDTVIPARCFLAPLADGGFVGADLSNCVTGASPGGSALWRYDGAQGWQPLVVPGLAGVNIDALAVAPDQRSLAVVTELHDLQQTAQPGVRIADLTTGQIVASAMNRDISGQFPVQYMRDGRLLITTYDDHAVERQLLWQPGQGPPGVVVADPLSGLSDTDRVFSDGVTLLNSHHYEIDRTLMATGRNQPPLALTGVVAGGFMPDGKMFWAASAQDGLRFWNTSDWTVAMSLYLLIDQTYFASAPSGHYDTNLGPDSTLFRWIVRDAPLQSLGPQTFMRDYFAPRFADKVLDGTDNTDGLVSILSLDRVLPSVAITRVAQGPSPDTALVSLTVREGIDRGAANGKTRSGLYNLRLFRDNALIAQWPTDSGAVALIPSRAERDTDLPPHLPTRPPTIPVGYGGRVGRWGGRSVFTSVNSDIASWQHGNALVPGADGLFHATYLAHLPTGADAASHTFSAYAFNADRVKSDTVSQSWTRPAMPPRPRHAYVLTIGINKYAQSRLQLHYAANDAQLLAQRLGKLPGYDVRQVVLAGTAEARSPPITKALIAAALDLLSGGNRTADLATLAAAGIDATGFATATPDDLVVVTFSGHGWADPHGNFYLLPAEASWPDTAAIPDTTTLVSSAEITTWLRGIDAGAMAMVIDACHSAASVANGEFRPGPMGDPGLGQLAYDKGIRILAATQTDDVAFEDATLRQGLLTYALAGEGIDDSGFGRADLNRDGQIMIDEWLRYALQRMPSLSADARARRTLTGAATGIAPQSMFTVISDSQALPPKSQDPALFDFNTQPSREALRIKAP